MGSVPMHETQVQSLGQEDPLEKGMATHCSILAWRVPWTEEPVGLQSTVSQRVGHDLATEHAAGSVILMILIREALQNPSIHLTTREGT